MSNLKLTGIIGLVGAILCGTGEFLLHFDPQARFSGYDFMADISDARLTAGHFFAVVGVPLYFVGMWHIAQMLQPAGEKLSNLLFLIGSFGFLYGAMWMSSRASIGSLVHYPELINQTNLVSLYELRSDTTDFVKVKLPNTVKSVGAMITATLSDGRTLYRPFVKGEGLCSDSTPIITIGTGGADVTSVETRFLTGETVTSEVPGAGGTITIDSKPDASRAEEIEQ
jgi:hypothetical protein